MIKILSLLLAVLLFALILLAGRESQAIIYEEVHEKGLLTFPDDLQRAPERHRALAVIVSG
jgi:hypothetical protein